MSDPLTPEKLISTNALLFFLLPSIGMILITSGSVGQYFSGSGLLAYSLLCAVGPLIYIVLGLRTDGRNDRRRFWWAFAVCIVLVVGLTGRQLAIRSGSSVAGIHDGAVQAEVAASKLLRGENPYGADYRHTAYETLNPPIAGGPAINVVWSHFIYPPLIFLLDVPLQLLRSFLGPVADYRIITVGALGGVATILMLTATTWTQKTRAALLTLGNPLLWIYAIIGANDIVAALCLLAASMLLIRRRWWWSGMVFGLAMAAKQSIWPLAPLWCLWLWQSTVNTGVGSKARRNNLLGALTSMVVAFGPFLLWHPGRMVNDLVRYASGSIPYSYPISGTTFLQYLNVFHIVQSPWSIIPTYIFQLAVGLPVMFFVWHWMRHSSSPIRWFAGSAVVLMSILLVSRYFNNNYFTVPAIAFIAAYLWSEQGTEST